MDKPVDLSDFSYPIRFLIPMRFLITHAISECLKILSTFRFLNTGEK